jgi:hypothetical protein
MAEKYPEEYVMLSCGWIGPTHAIDWHRETSNHLNDDPKSCIRLEYVEGGIMTHRYKSNVVEIEAAHWNGSEPKALDIVSWIQEHGSKAKFLCGGQCCDNVLAIEVNTLEGLMRAQPQDYIIKGTENEFYPCKPSIFQTKYTQIPEVHA